MYGRVVVNKPELKFREYDIYRSFYCGLCQTLKKKYGNISRISLSYDATFIILLLNGLYEPDIVYEKKCCIAHPISKQEMRSSIVTEYAADMNLLLFYYKCQDDWFDEKKVTRKAYASFIEKKVQAVEKKYPDKAQLIKENLSRLSEFERASESNIDRVADCFGNILAAILEYNKDEWSCELNRTGFYLGKFIYILDAYEDLEKDIENKRYNVLASHREMSGFKELVKAILENLMANCVRSFERLPIIENVEILRNILYSGVWTHFNEADNAGGAKKE